MLFVYAASLLCSAVWHTHLGPTSHSGHHPQSLCGRISKCTGPSCTCKGQKSPVLGSLLTRLTLNKGWREHFSESSRCLKLLMATYLLNFKPLSSMLCAHGIKLRRDMAIHTIHSTKTEQILWLVKGYIIDCALKKLLSPSSKDKKHKQVILIQCQRHSVL